MTPRIGQALFGLVVGVGAALLLPGHDTAGLILPSALGLTGGWMAGLAGERLGLYESRQAAGFVMSMLGAIALMLLYGIFIR